MHFSSEINFAAKWNNFFCIAMADTEISEKITLYFSTIPSNHEVSIFFHSSSK